MVVTPRSPTRGEQSICGKSGERWACATSSRAACRRPDRLRINVQLVEAATGAHLWAERFDRPIEDVFEVQDEITRRVVEELDVTLVTGEQARAWRRLAKNPVAYSEALAGRAVQAKEHTIDSMLKSRDHYQRAIELDPGFALPWAYMVSVYTHLVDAGYKAEPAVSYEAALRYANRAVKLNPDLAIARAYRGVALQQLARYEEAAREYALAVQSGPNAADSLMLSAWGIAAVGDAAAALPLAIRALLRRRGCGKEPIRKESNAQLREGRRRQYIGDFFVEVKPAN